MAITAKTYRYAEGGDNSDGKNKGKKGGRS